MKFYFQRERGRDWEPLLSGFTSKATLLLAPLDGTLTRSAAHFDALHNVRNAAIWWEAAAALCEPCMLQAHSYPVIG